MLRELGAKTQDFLKAADLSATLLEQTRNSEFSGCVTAQRGDHSSVETFCSRRRAEELRPKFLFTVNDATAGLNCFYDTERKVRRFTEEEHPPQPPSASYHCCSLRPRLLVLHPDLRLRGHVPPSSSMRKSECSYRCREDGFESTTSTRQDPSLSH